MGIGDLCGHYTGIAVRYFKVIPQKKKLPINFFETFPECSPPSIVSKKKKKQ